MALDIEALTVFVAITETGSFTAAGHRVGRTQSAVSQQVKKLEGTLGRPLFERGRGRVELTEDGRRLLVHAREVLDSHDRALEAFRLSEGRGRVAVGMPEIYADFLLDRLLPEFRLKAPQVELSLTMSNSPELVRMLGEGRLDLAFITDGEADGLQGPVISRERAVWLGATAVDLTRAHPLPIIVWGEGSNYRRTVLTALEREARAYRVVMTTRSFGGMLSAIRNGLGIAAATALNAGEGLRVLGPESGLPELRSLGIHLERRDNLRNKAARQFEAHALEVFGVEG